MKKTLCMIFAMLLMLCALSACKKAATQPENTNTVPGFEENVFGDDTTDSTTAPTQAATTEPTQATQTTEPTQVPQATEPTQGQTTATQATTQTPSTETPTPPAEDTTPTLADEYEAYTKMSESEKSAFRSSFADYDAFFEWYKAAMKAYQEANAPIPIPPDGNVDLS